MRAARAQPPLPSSSVTTCLSPFLALPSPSPAVVLHRGQLLGLRGESKVPAFAFRRPPSWTPWG